MSDLSREGLTALTWVFTGAAILLTAGRYAIRLRTVKKLHADDYIHGAALVILIGYVSAYTVMFPLNYSVEFWVAGPGEQPSAQELARYFRLEIAVSLLFWVIITLVKFSFLFFYRFLFGVSKSFMRAWWIVTAFTVVSFLVCFISVFWACESPRHLLITDRCLSERALSRTAVITSMWCGLNVASDLSIIVLPLWMLRSLQMPISRKVMLAALFLIAITDVIFDITRTVYTVDGGAVALDTVWDILEPTIAVIISALPSYMALLTKTKKRKTTSYQNLVGNSVSVWSGARNNEESRDLELSLSSGHVPRDDWAVGSADKGQTPRGLAIAP